jgi:soluble lytic murein transglycosylase-like protein
MALQVNSPEFILRAGPYKIAVKNRPQRFHIKNGDAITVTGKVVQAGASPVLDPLNVVPVELHAVKATAFDPNVVTPQEEQQFERWHQWICSFNRRLSPDTAGKYAAVVFQYSRYYRIDPRLVLAVVGAESGFEKDAVSSAGAIGLGQLMPETAAQMGIPNPRDPAQNLVGCIRYLYLQMRRWEGRKDQLPRVIASYNAGEGAVEKYNGVPPYAETQAYVIYVRSLYRELGGL